MEWVKYIEFISTFDCYVNLSKGEGFSIPPRESLALGIPCIISDNTAHKTICDSGLVLPVTSKILQMLTILSYLVVRILGIFIIAISMMSDLL